MSEFHDDYPQYELMAHHSEEAGKVMRRKLWNVFWIMLGITILELIIGSYAKELHLIDELDRSSTSTLKIIFIGLTLGKAYYIIYKFMHLEHEKKGVKYAVIAPYTVFILYLVYVLVAESNYSKVHKTKIDHLIEQQKIDLNAAAASGHGHEAGATHEAAAHEGAEHHEAAPEEHH
jgi:cytochrome c oxidase subunit IV